MRHKILLPAIVLAALIAVVAILVREPTSEQERPQLPPQQTARAHDVAHASTHQAVSVHPRHVWQPAPAPTTGTRQAITSVAVEESAWQGQTAAGIRARAVRPAGLLLSGEAIPAGTRLEFRLFDDASFTAIVRDSFVNVNGTVSTLAHLEGQTWGRVAIAFTDGELRIKLLDPDNNRAFALHYNHDDGTHYALELDKHLLSHQEACQLTHDSHFAHPRPALERRAEASGGNDEPETGLPLAVDESIAVARVDVMVVYPRNVRAAAGTTANVQNIAAQGIALANDAHQGIVPSGSPHTRTGIYVNLVHTAEFETYDDSGSNGTELDRLTDSDGIIDIVHTWRNTHSADFVCMMTTDSGGLGWRPDLGEDPDSAFNTNGWTGFDSYTPAHELGHNMGLSHSKYQTGSARATDWNSYDSRDATGWHWHPGNDVDTAGRRSIMAYDQHFDVGTTGDTHDGHARVPQFANADVDDPDYAGIKMGNDPNADTTRLLRGQAALYANYRVPSLSSDTIDVLHPDGGQGYAPGELIAIRWHSDGVSGNVSIELHKNGAFTSTIIASTPDDGIYNWTIPGGTTAGSDYKVRIASINEAAVTDLSDANFFIGSFRLQYFSGANGSISGTSDQTVAAGGSGSSITTTADPGYFLDSWSDNSMATSRTDLAVAGNVYATATFLPGTLIYATPLDAHPGWQATGSWDYGAPTSNNGAGGPTSPYSGTKIFDTNLNGGAFADGNLTTHAIDCSAYENVRLRFASQFSVYTGYSARVQVSTNGVTFHDLEVITGTPNTYESAWSIRDIDASEYADRQGIVFFRWRHQDDGGGSNFDGMAIDDVRVVGDLAKAVAYSDSTFEEAGANDGSITNSITLSLSAETFTGSNGDNLATGGKATISNVPTGLTATLIRTSPTSATLNLTGNASPHTNGQDLANLTVSLNDTAFAGGDASLVDGAFRNDLVVNFFTNQQFTVTYAAGAGGTLSGPATQTVEQGEDASQVTANPNANHFFVNWTGDRTSTDERFTITNVQGNIAVTANFHPGNGTYPYAESFDAGSFRIWTNATVGDEIDWAINSTGHFFRTQPNPSGPAGPADGAGYIYLSDGSPAGESGILSASFSFADLVLPRFSFQYHMYGSDVRTLQLQASIDDGTTWDTVWNQSGNQGDTWHTATVDLVAYGRQPVVDLRFVGTCSPFTYSSVIALDDFNLDEALAPDNALVISPNGGETLLRHTTLPYQYDIIWAMNAEGPVYIELLTDGINHVITNNTENDGHFKWILPSHLIPDNDYQILVASVDTPAANDISDADFTIAAANPDAIASLPHTATFDSDEGSWTQGTTNEWLRNSGSTGSDDTGPDGANQGSHYLYTEASGATASTFDLENTFDLSSAVTPLLSFDYHMYGAAMGSLQVDVSVNDGTSWTTLWSDSGDKGQTWFNDQAVDLSDYCAVVKLRFRGTTGSDFRSDMAIDDVRIIDVAEVPTYAVTYDANNPDSGSAPDDQTKVQDVTLVLRANVSNLARVGHAFAGWNTQANGQGTSFAESASYTANAALSLFAKWSINEYTLSFNANGGTETAAITQDYATIVTAPDAPTRSGHTFAAWDPLVPATMPAASSVHTAQWTINQYAITFNPNGGSETPTITQDFATSVSAPTPPTRTGHTFDGWDPALPSTMPAENLAVSAQWTINEYVLSFDANGGTETPSITQDFGTSINAPDAPTRSGFTFNGWDPALPATMPAASTLHTAIWAQSHSVTFLEGTNGVRTGGGQLDQTVLTGNSAVAPEITADPGFVFEGWDTSLDNVSGDLTITALYGTAPSPPAGAGTLGSPYQISNLAELRWLSETTLAWDSFCELTAHIEAAETIRWNNGRGFSPIGNNSTLFTGGFAGLANSSIRDLFINRPEQDSVGLFGYASTGAFSGIVLTDVNVTGRIHVGSLVGKIRFTGITDCTASGVVTGDSGVGGLVGFAILSSDIQHVSTTTTVNGPNSIGGVIGIGGANASLANASASGQINGTSNIAGGLVGEISGFALSNSYATGKVNGTGIAGGLVGHVQADSTITDCYATGNVSGKGSVGGFAGLVRSNSTLNRTSASGNVTASGLSSGGFAGSIEDSQLSDVYAAGTVAGEFRVGGLVGEATDSTITNAYASGGATGSNSIGGLVALGQSSTFTGCFFNLDAATVAASAGLGDSPSAAGITALTAIEMRDRSNFVGAGWNFETVWGIAPGSFPDFAFRLPTYSLEYAVGEGPGSLSGATSQTVHQGGDGSAVTAVPAANHHFVQWSDASTANPRRDVDVNANLSVSADFAIDTYDVTYLPNNATSGSAPAAQLKTHDVDVTLAAVGDLARTDYVFIGWNTANDGSGDSFAESATYAANADITLYAEWAAIYPVTYNDNSATSGDVPADQTKVQGLDLTLRDNSGALVKTGYTFSGWNTQSDGLGTNFAESASYAADAPLTLFAKWTINTYPITYDANSATSGDAPASQLKTYDVPITLRTNSAALARIGHAFAGWNTQADGQGIDFAESANYLANAPLSLFAKWIINTYALNYVAGPNGSVSANASQTVNHGSAGAPVTAIPTANHHFVRWSDGSTDNPRTDLNVTANLNVTAEFAIDTYVLRYAAGFNGSLSSFTPQTVDHGSDGSPVTAIAAPNHHFSHWSDGSTDNPRTDLNVTANLNVTARFAINQYALTYLADANGSVSGPSPQTVDHGSDGAPVTAIPAANYHFDKWSDDSTDNPRTDLNVTANLTVTAEFAIDVYVLSYAAGFNGSLSSFTPQTVEHGSDGSPVTAIPAPNYHFTEWSDGSTDNPRTDLNVTANGSVTARFAINTYEVTFLPGDHGSITAGAPQQTIDHGSAATAPTVTPTVGYGFTGWNLAFDEITADLTVTAQYQANNVQLQILPTIHTVPEGTTANLQITLSDQPIGPLTITVEEVSTAREATAKPLLLPALDAAGQVLWTTADSDFPVSAQEDDNADDEQTILRFTATGHPNVAPVEITVNQSDDDFVVSLAADLGGTADGPGIVDPDDNEITITATPNAGFRFVAWLNDVAAIADPTQPSATFIVTSDLAITADFNQVPTASVDSYQIDEDALLTVELPAGVLANDDDDDSLTARITKDVDNGTLNFFDDGSFTYQAKPHYHGSDTFAYVANDGVSDTEPTTVTITIASIPDPPVIDDFALVDDVDAPLAVTPGPTIRRRLLVSDPDDELPTHQLLSTDPTTPAADDPRWQTIDDLLHTLSVAGVNTVFIWVKDAQNQISTPASATIEWVPPFAVNFQLTDASRDLESASLGTWREASTGTFDTALDLTAQANARLWLTDPDYDPDARLAADFRPDLERVYWRLQVDPGATPATLSWTSQSAAAAGKAIMLMPIANERATAPPIDLQASPDGTVAVNRPTTFLVAYAPEETKTFQLRQGWNWLPMPLIGPNNNLDAILSPAASPLSTGARRRLDHHGRLISHQGNLLPKQVVFVYSPQGGTTAPIVGIRPDSTIRTTTTWQPLSLADDLPPQNALLADLLRDHAVFSLAKDRPQYRRVSLLDGIQKDVVYFIRLRSDSAAPRTIDLSPQ